MQDDDALSVPGGRSTSTSPRNTSVSNKGMLLLVPTPAAAIMVVGLLVVAGGGRLVGGSLGPSAGGGDGCKLQRERCRQVGRLWLEMEAIYMAKAGKWKVLHEGAGPMWARTARIG